jgi:hypothetical protein
VLLLNLLKNSLAYERLGSQLHRGCPSCRHDSLVRQGLYPGAVMRLKIAIGIIAVWWLLQVALFVLRGLE